jgi:inorganic triphosphatase YgiF
MGTGVAQEVELKLELTPGAADALEAALLFPGDPEIIHQRAIYFDTPDQLLSASGVSLRIRHDGSKRVQTVKVNGGAAAGMFVRSEWEREVENDIPVLDETTPIPLLMNNRIANIDPLFSVENQRHLWAGEDIEISLDRGCVIAGERELPFCEVELEQKGADPTALFALARRIDAIVPVRLGVLSKSERGYRLLESAPATAKAASMQLDPGMTAGRAFQEIMHACLRQFRLNEPLIVDNREAAALHQARVALRRLRSALSINRPMLADQQVWKLNGELRWLAGALGMARDLDVLAERAGDGPLLERLMVERDKAYAEVAVTLASDRARAIMLDLAEWIAAGAWLSSVEGQDLRNLPVREFATQILDRFRKKVKAHGRDLEELDDEARHEVRKAAKKLRYAAEFYASLYGSKQGRRRRKRFLSALEALQDQLGALNDLATAPRLLKGLGLADTPDAQALLGARKKSRLLSDAAEAHDALLDAKRFWR